MQEKQKEEVRKALEHLFERNHHKYGKKMKECFESIKEIAYDIDLEVE